MHTMREADDMETRCYLTLEYLSTRLCPEFWSETSKLIQYFSTEEVLDGVIG